MPAWLPLAMMGASAVAQGIRGISQGKQAKDLKSVYDKAEADITPVGPEMQAYMNRLGQQERFMRMGTDAASQFGRRATANALAQTNNSLVRAGGGANTIGNLLRGQQGAGNAYANIAANAGQQANQMLQYQGALTQHLNELNYQRQRERRNIAQSRWAHMQQASQDNLNTLYGIGAQMATMMPESMWGPRLKPAPAMQQQAANSTVQAAAQYGPQQQPMGMYYPAPQPPQMQPMPQPPALLGFGPNTTNYLPGWSSAQPSSAAAASSSPDGPPYPPPYWYAPNKTGFRYSPQSYPENAPLDRYR